MIFADTPLEDAYVIELEPKVDERGFFARAWCQDEFAAKGLDTAVVQCNVSFNHVKGTLRGLHFQLPPRQEVKLIRCTQGAIWDVIVDVRKGSPTFKQWFGVELSADNRKALYVPKGFAHGYLTLAPNTEAFYQVSEFYTPGYESGIRWDDPAIGISWPAGVEVISDKDAAFPDFDLTAHYSSTRED